MTASHKHLIPNTIDYLELTADDLPRATAFYSAAFGWEFTAYGDGYSGFRTRAETEDGEEAGGIGLTEEGAGLRPPFPLLYSEDLDATLNAIVAAGGEILVKPYDFPGGRRFHFLDPAGNELGVWARR